MKDWWPNLGKFHAVIFILFFGHYYHETHKMKFHLYI
jgi:hypothetical protein